jgi:hypothetical protein
MAVERMTFDLWCGIKCKEELVCNPGVEQFERALQGLDGNKRTLLCLESAKGPQLVVGGGDGGYIVYIAFSDMEFWNLLSDIESDERVLITAGGQQGDYPLRQVVDKQRAYQAGVAFLRHGGLAENLKWESKNSSLH